MYIHTAARGLNVSPVPDRLALFYTTQESFVFFSALPRNDQCPYTTTTHAQFYRRRRVAFNLRTAGAAFSSVCWVTHSAYL